MQLSEGMIRDEGQGQGVEVVYRVRVGVKVRVRGCLSAFSARGYNHYL